jgi:hypothetical protein
MCIVPDICWGLGGQSVFLAMNGGGGHEQLVIIRVNAIFSIPLR